MAFQKLRNSKVFNLISYWLSIIILNITITLLLVTLLLVFLAIESRYSKRENYSYLEKFTTIDECKNTKHGILSLEQARILGRDQFELNSYCASLALIPKEWKNERTYWDYHYYSQKKLSTPKINFNDVDQFNSREVPCSTNSQLLKKHKIIWMFGGSTLQNLETSDQNTIANIFCETYSVDEHIKVMNLGVGSFTSEMEIAKLLNLYKISLNNETQLPDIAIFYDGYNDAQRLMIGGSWAGLPPGVASRLAVAYSPPSSYHQAFYWLLRSFNDLFTAFAGGHKNIVTEAFSTLIKKLENKPLNQDHPILKTVDWRTEVNGVLLASKAYIHDQRVLSSICKTLKVTCFTFFQPVLANRKKPVGEVELANFQSQQQNGVNQITIRFYGEVKKAVKELENEYYYFIDLSELPNNPKYINLPMFYDFGHGGFFSGEIIGREMALELFRARRLQNKSNHN
jgi:hypothetical protein